MPNGALVSIGYEGRTLDEFVDVLRKDGVTEVVDVRLAPFSRKPGFSKSKLRDALAAADIDYVHEPTLGNPKDNREPFRAGQASAHERDRAHLLREGDEAIAVVRARALGIEVTYLEEDPPAPAATPRLL